METIVIYYQGNKDPGLESQVENALRSYQAVIVSEFQHDNQVFQAIARFKNSGQLENFKSDLNSIGRVFKTKISIGGYLA